MGVVGGRGGRWERGRVERDGNCALEDGVGSWVFLDFLGFVFAYYLAFALFQERASGFGGLILGKSLVMRYVMGHRRSTEQCVGARLYALVFVEWSK